MDESSTDTEESRRPPITGNLARVRGMFVLYEAYVIAVALWCGWTPASLLVVAPGMAAQHGLGAALGIVLIAVPMLAAAIYLFRRRRSARAPLLYASLVTGAVIAGAAESQHLLLVYLHQAALVGVLWLPRIDAVLSPTYRDEVMAAAPLVGRSRRAAWACVFLMAMGASGVALLVVTS